MFRNPFNALLHRSGRDRITLALPVAVRLLMCCLLVAMALPLANAQGNVTATPPNGTFSAVGGTLDFSVAAAADVSWTATSSAAWLQVVAGASGTGPGVVRVTATTNELDEVRTAELRIGDFTAYLVQEPLVAIVRFLSPAISVGPAGAQRSINVVVQPANLPWQAVATVDWISIVTGRDVGSGQVNFVVSANTTGATRVGQIRVVNSSLTVTQTGNNASFNVTPGSAEVPFEGGTGQVAVTANPETAEWGAYAANSWIQVTANQFVGNGVVGYTVAPNPLGQIRTGGIRIADRLFVIRQAANPNPATPDPVTPSSTFRLSSGIVSINAPVDSTQEVSQALGINSTGDALNFTVEVEGAPWLRARRTTGTTPDNIIFTANPSGLAVGTYFGTIRLRSTSNSAVVQLPARLRINPPPGTPEQPLVRPNSLFFSRIVGQAVPPSRTVQVGLPGDAITVSTTFSVPVPWLQVAAASDFAGTRIVASIRDVSMMPGLYETEIIVSSAGGQFSTFRIPVSYRVQLAPMNAPYILSSGIVNAASFESGVSSNTWISIFGTNLAKTTRSWMSSDFQGGRLPLILDGVEVLIGGTKVAISYVSPTQLNVLAPASTSLGRKEIVVIVDGVASESAALHLSEVLPAFFTFAPMSGKYAAALHLDNAPVGPANLFPTGRAARPAKPGEVIQVFGTGFGATNPPADPSRLLATPAPLIDFESLEIRIGGLRATVGFSGLSGTGLNQLNITVPALPEGDHEIVARISGTITRTGVFIHVKP